MKLSTRFVFVFLFSMTLGSFPLAFAHDHSEKGVAPTDQKKTPPPKAFDSSQKVGAAATCPVAGESFKIAKDTLSSQYDGKWVYFCCPDCKTQFDQDPAHFLPAKTSGH
ncbi:YHS domain-containing protein [Bdellovibrionota bacterium FG-2]